MLFDVELFRFDERQKSRYKENKKARYIFSFHESRQRLFLLNASSSAQGYRQCIPGLTL